MLADPVVERFQQLVRVDQQDRRLVAGGDGQRLPPEGQVAGVDPDRGEALLGGDAGEHVEQRALAHPARSVHEEHAGTAQRLPEHRDLLVATGEGAPPQLPQGVSE
ncbi:hypothetical protein GCM10017774_81510 [Lentzea cavernae]|uniref:Uncharacterized protein n=1 Tax=Lentzea cavernae TaxID=2020703 RepID=A0ABQ3MVG5_9PSEU|nr:hypothetical protein GCM10017774_81510 [Lentzea cavernae]